MASIANCTPANIVPGLRKHSGLRYLAICTVKFNISFVQMHLDKLKCTTKFFKIIEREEKTLKTQIDFTTLGTWAI